MSNVLRKRKLDANANASSTASGIVDSRQSIEEGRKNLPVYKFRKDLCEKILQNEVVLVTSETGSGKSTQIPQYMLDFNLLTAAKGISNALSICVTQPRRVAAITVASRVAKERNCRLGTEVGYRVRFDDKTTPGTRLIYATDGMLLRHAMLDPLLASYSVIVLDEAHERSLQTDILVCTVLPVFKIGVGHSLGSSRFPINLFCRINFCLLSITCCSLVLAKGQWQPERRLWGTGRQYLLSRS
jgi:HrpA-like RNA helicase